jgi:hypothetical protein
MTSISPCLRPKWHPIPYIVHLKNTKRYTRELYLPEDVVQPPPVCPARTGQMYSEQVYYR